MTPRLLAPIVATAAACAASGQPSADGFDASRAWTHLVNLVAIGPRVAGTPEGVATRAYLIKSLDAAGIAAEERPFEAATPFGRVRMANVVATLPGERPDRIILASHFDTKLFKAFRFVGANDGGSSTAVLLELGRVLADRPRPFTIELLFFDGEEAFVEWSRTDSTYGSRHYVQDARARGALESIRALILLDMVGDRDLNIRRESYSTRWLTDIIWATAARLGYGRHFVDDELAVEDDHLPFLEAGIPAVDIIDLDYPHWHRATDTLEQVSERSLQIVGEVVLAALPEIEQRLLQP